jgi:hypothetical protein
MFMRKDRQWSIMRIPQLTSMWQIATVIVTSESSTRWFGTREAEKRPNFAITTQGSSTFLCPSFVSNVGISSPMFS